MLLSLRTHTYTEPIQSFARIRVNCSDDTISAAPATPIQLQFVWQFPEKLSFSSNTSPAKIDKNEWSNNKLFGSVHSSDHSKRHSFIFVYLNFADCLMALFHYACNRTNWLLKFQLLFSCILTKDKRTKNQAHQINCKMLYIALTMHTHTPTHYCVKIDEK